MRAFTKEAFNRMHLSSPGMEFASEMVIKATLLKLRRTEVGITLRRDGRDRPPHLHPWRDGWRHLRYILMLSPAGLYFGPALLLGILGAAIFALLLSNRASLVVDVGPVWFGDHWLFIAGAMVVASHQALAFGLATTVFGIVSGYRKPPGWLRRLMPYLRLEISLLAGLAMILVSAIVLIGVYSEWAREGYGALQRLRELAAASTLALVGIQTIFGSYLLAIVSGNEADLSRILVEECHAPGDHL